MPRDLKSTESRERVLAIGETWEDRFVTLISIITCFFFNYTGRACFVFCFINDVDYVA
jgi:hypothetical protein